MTLDCNPLGVILTMDNWSTMGQGYIDRFFREAEQQIAASGDDIDERDHCRIVFLPIQDLERCLSIASYQSLLEAIETASQKKYLGWKFESILMKSPSYTQKAERAYPFTDRLSALLPWWGHTLEEGDPRNGADFAQ